MPAEFDSLDMDLPSMPSTMSAAEPREVVPFFSFVGCATQRKR